MLDCMIGRPPGRRLPGRHVDGRQPLLRRHADRDPAALRRGARPDHEGVDRSPSRSPFNGRYNKLRYVNPWPQPLQKPHPPMWLAGGGSVETWELAVDNDYTYSYLSFFGYQFAQEADGRASGRRRSPSGADDNPYRAGFAQQICVAETDAQAEEQYLEHVTLLLQQVPAHPAVLLRDARATAPAAAPSSPSRPTSPARSPQIAAQEKNWKTLGRQRLHHRRQPVHRRRPADRGGEGPAHRQPASRCCRSARCPTSSPSRTSPCSPRRSSRRSATCGPTRAGSTSGGPPVRRIAPLHPHTTRQRSRISHLEELIVYMKSKPGVWFATAEDIAKYIKQQTQTAGSRERSRPQG